ncbi:YifB family Mg chelatase-like AAA ATPase [Luethyella okanaganae]|uniref:YifB family Mg chelatase-like AAA ATPase n=1 Tax=Luethyella okanaganae TaxID=69372 RepID=A0ABW1VEA2_9MICO
MRFGRTHAVALIGMSGSIVEVEADISSQLPAIVLIGLPDAALAQSAHRVRAAASNAGIPLSTHRITVNLSPAALPKHGSGFDLAIALACLAAAGDIAAESIERVVHIGELGLDGRLRPIPGVLPAVVAAQRAGHTTVMVPAGSVAEAELVSGMRVVGVASLRDAAIWHGGAFDPIPVDAVPPSDVPVEEPILGEHVADLVDVVGQDAAVLALQVAAAGGHHAFLLGPPGAGKTMLAGRLPGLLPDLDERAALEVSSIRSLGGRAVGRALATRPPLESPHHTATAAAIIGGGSSVIRPGAAARAAHGVLFLDEAPEFSASVLDALRQPLESGVISIHRANAVAHFPGRFQLLLAANPCPCGQYGVEGGECSCAPNARRRYLGRLSGPLLDRIDIQLRVQRVTTVQLRAALSLGRMSTAEARGRVVNARAAAAARLASTPWRLNSEVPGRWLRGTRMRPGSAAMAGLDRALERGGITMRGYDRVLRVAWSVADLEGASVPTGDHIGQALYLRKGI